MVITFGWVADHALESAGFVGLEDFTFGIAFKIFGNGIDEHCSGGGGKIRDISTVEVIPDVPKLDVAEAGGDDEGALAVAIVPDVVDGVGVVEYAEAEYVGNARWIEIHDEGPEISFLSSD